MDYCEAINKLPGSKENGLYGKSCLKTWDMTDEEIEMLRKTAVRYVDEHRRAKSFAVALHDEKAVRE